MSYDKPDCFFREEQIWNNVYDDSKKIIRVGSGGKVSPHIEIVEISNKDTEESFEFPQGTVALSIRDRGNSLMRYAFESGEVEDENGSFLDYGPHSILKEESLSLTENLRIYFASSKDSRKIEIVYWN